MNLKELLRDGFNTSALPKAEFSFWTVHFLETATLRDMADCLHGLEVIDPETFFKYLVDADTSDASVQIELPAGREQEVLDRLQSHAEVGAVIGTTDSTDTFYLLHQKPNYKSQTLIDALDETDALVDKIWLLVGDHTRFGPAI